MRRISRGIGRRYWLVSGLVVIAMIFLADWEQIGESFFNVEIIRDMFPEVITIAAKNTIIYTILGFTGGLILGLVLALMRLSTSAPFRWVSAVYIDVVRGIPLLVWILLIGLGLPIARSIARLQGGQLTCESPDDGGASFVCTMPLESPSIP